MANNNVQDRFKSLVASRLGGGTTQGATTKSAQQELEDFQEWLTLAGPATISEIIQACGKWKDGRDSVAYTLESEILAISNVSLLIESAPNREGPWNTVVAFTGTTNIMVVMSSEGGNCRFSRYIRWHLLGDGANAWEVCFRLNLMPGTTLDRSVLKPREV